MNALAATIGATGWQAPPSQCFHCEQPVRDDAPRLVFDGAERAFCCEGCAAAARWIDDARLQDYYRLRQAPAGRVDTTATDLAHWDAEDVLSEHARAIPGGLELVLLTDGMRCAACAWLIDRALAREAGVLDVAANAVTGRIRVAWDPRRTTLGRVLAGIVALGYRPWLAGGVQREREQAAGRKRDLLRLGIAGLGAMQAMMFAEALYLDTDASMSIPMRDFLRWVAFLVSTPVVFFAGAPFLAGAWRELRQHRIGADGLIAGSTLLAYVASLVETVRGGPHVWYDAAVMFVFLLLAARMLEHRMRRRANARVEALARMRPAFATRETVGGMQETVPLSALRVGDVACVAAGEPVPADGVLVGDSAAFEESLLTGESTPVPRRDGDPVYAGVVSRERAARVRVTAIGARTRISQLAALVERAQSHRPPVARAADRAAAWFAGGLLLVTVLVFAWWRQHDPARALEVTLALLVVSCPCALSLSIPAALAAANDALARMGMLPLAEDALDRLARVTDIVFDKTGTLCDATPALDGVVTFGPLDAARALHIAAALERGGTHPLAAAFAPHADDRVVARDVRLVAASGVEGVVDGLAWRLGHASFACGRSDDDALWLGDGTSAFARFAIRERLRPQAGEAIAALRAAGVRVHVCSGDAHAAVERVATRLGIGDAHSRQTPEDKLERVRALQRDGRVVAMVGDGLNDAPVLAGADVSIAMSEGASLAQRAATLLLATPSLLRIPESLVLARRTRRIIRQNLAWALGYNLLALPLAAAGLVAPWLAALGMAMSSLIVTLNALRLARAPRCAEATA